MELIDTRKNALSAWLKNECQLDNVSLVPMPGDASFRRYFRVEGPKGTWVAMDAPPPENCQPFVDVDQALQRAGISVPEIKYADIQNGYLLLSDFGNTTYLRGLTADNADQLYGHALLALSILQGVNDVPGHALRAFDADFMLKEWAWHKEWFLHQLLGLKLSPEEEHGVNTCYQRVVDLCVSQPQVFMHRDYHAGNLMVLPGRSGVGVLDFQDAMIGPVTYDLVSLLRDCYIAWPEENVRAWVYDYFEKLTIAGVLKGVPFETFMQWFDWMGVERHLKAIFTFSRKHVRDDQSSYLKHIPRTLGYLSLVTARYPDLAPLFDYVTMTASVFKRVVVCEQ